MRDSIRAGEKKSAWDLKGALSGLGQFLENETLLKMMKNAFHFTLKAISFLRYLDFCLGFLVMYENGRSG